MKRTLVACLVALGCTLAGTAQQTYKDKQSYKDWPKLAAKLDDDFFTTQEALRIGDNVLLYQQTGTYMNYERAAALSVLMFLLCMGGALVYIRSNMREDVWEKGR